MKKALKKHLSLLLALTVMLVTVCSGTCTVSAANWNMGTFLKTYSDPHFNLNNEPNRAMTVEEYIAITYAYSYYGKGSTKTPAKDKNGRAPSTWCAKYVQAEVDKGTVIPANISYTDPVTVAFAAEFLSRAKGKYNYDFNNVYSFSGTDVLSAESKMFLNVAVDHDLIPYTAGMNASQGIIRKNASSYEVKSGAVSVKPAAAAKKNTMRDTAVFLPDAYGDTALLQQRYNDLKRHADTVTMVTFCSAYIRGKSNNGNTLIDHNLNAQKDIIKWCNDSGKLSLMGVTDGFQKEPILNAISSAAASEKLINEMIGTVDKYNMDGVNLDIETVAAQASYRSAYSSFITKLANKLHSEGKVLMVSVGAYFTSAQEQKSIFDYTAIGKAADYVDVILYDDYPDTNYKYNHKAGPMSNIVRIGRVMRYAAVTIPAYKLQLGMSGFAIDYNTSKRTAADIHYDQALNLKNQYKASMAADTAESGGHFTYNAADGAHIVYLETTAGMRDRLELVNRYGFNGINIYFAGSNCTQLYNAVSDYSTYHDEIVSAMNAGLVPVSLRNNYSAAITRADFCRLISQFIESSSGKSISEYMKDKGIDANSGSFRDTSDSNVLAASALGIVTGYDDGTFKPTKTITRREAAAMLKRLADVTGCKESTFRTAFKDISDQPEWAKTGINFVTACADPSTGNKVMNGTGSSIFSPNANYTREQSIMTMIRLFNALKHQK